MELVTTALFLLLVGVFTTICPSLIRYVTFKYKFRNVDGPRGIPFFGNVFQLGKDSSAALRRITQWTEQYRSQGFFILFFGMQPLLVVYNANDMEKCFRNTKLDAKGYYYKFLRPWLGDGLLLSNGGKWAHRRKLLTPSFHFTILNKFLDVFNEQAECFTEKMCGLADGRSVDIAPLVSMCTLDVICETIMGMKLGSQKGKGREYVSALHRLGTLNQIRLQTPWIRTDFIFNLSDTGKEAAKCQNILHDTTRKIIRERKLQAAGSDVIIDDKTKEVRKRRRLAFLDLLIEVQKQDETMTDDGIQEEVDTFMFEGHDTVATSIIFCLYLIGRHPDVQKKLHTELDQVFGEATTDHVTQEHLAKLEYLSCVMKESQRMTTAVPYISRTVEEEFHACGMMIPTGVSIRLDIFHLHHDPKYFPNPEVFDPDRFLPANSEKRHNFAFVPFSAGHRNCIGQKFALMEQKVILATLLRKIQVKSSQKMEDLRLAVEIGLRATAGLTLEIKMRH